MIISLRIFHTALIVVLFGTKYALSEVFTAISHMEDLIEVEEVLIYNLEGYIETQEHKINYLKKKLNEYQKEHSEAVADISEYLSNPINSYLLTKRLTSDWTQIEELIEYDVGIEFLDNVTYFRDILTFPSNEDLNGAAMSLARLQNTYNLSTSSIAKGELNGVKYRSEMSSNDVFELGRQLFINENYHYTVLWMKEAVARLKSEGNETELDFSRADVMEYLAYSIYIIGDVTTALDVTNRFLDIYPDHKGALGIKDYIKKDMAEKEKGPPDNESTSDLFIRLISEPLHPYYDDDEYVVYENYKKSCRGEVEPSPKKLRQLRCLYVSHQNNFLKLAPFKVEEVYRSPYIVIYHDVMYDHEIEYIKKTAKPRFERAYTLGKKGEPKASKGRISKAAWIKDSEHSYISSITQRAADITNLDMDYSENLQVVNYGIGGHYATHYDFSVSSQGKDVFQMGIGNRIATLLFYMSEVEQGGATVFPKLNLTLWPKKGSAALWYNLHKSGKVDRRTHHAGCPVLKGSKWVSNLWIHEYGQEFRRPCELFSDYHY